MSGVPPQEEAGPGQLNVVCTPRAALAPLTLLRPPQSEPRSWSLLEQLGLAGPSLLSIWPLFIQWFSMTFIMCWLDPRW